MAELLALNDDLRATERWLRDFYEDIWEVERILGAEGQTVKGAKRLLRKMRERWLQRIARPGKGDDKETWTIRAGWCNQTDSYWPGLFHCYADPRIPRTTNSIERHILDMKQLVRVISRNPNPAARFIRQAATNAVIVTRSKLPGEKFLASRSAADLNRAAAQLRARRRSLGLQRRVRRDLPGFANAMLERWKAACNVSSGSDPPKP